MPLFGSLHRAVGLVLAITLFISYASCLGKESSTYTLQQIVEYKLITSDLTVTIAQPRSNRSIIEIKVTNNNSRFITMSTFLTPLDVRENLVHAFDYPGRPKSPDDYKGLVIPKGGAQLVLLYPRSTHRREIPLSMLFGSGPGYGEMRNTTMQIKGLWQGVWAGHMKQVLENHGIPVPVVDSKKKKKGKKKPKLMVENIPAEIMEEFKSNVLNVVV